MANPGPARRKYRKTQEEHRKPQEEKTLKGLRKKRKTRIRLSPREKPRVKAVK